MSFAKISIPKGHREIARLRTFFQTLNKLFNSDISRLALSPKPRPATCKIFFTFHPRNNFLYFCLVFLLHQALPLNIDHSGRTAYSTRILTFDISISLSIHIERKSCPWRKLRPFFGFFESEESLTFRRISWSNTRC